MSLKIITFLAEITLLMAASIKPHVPEGSEYDGKALRVTYGDTLQVYHLTKSLRDDAANKAGADVLNLGTLEESESSNFNEGSMLIKYEWNDESKNNRSIVTCYFCQFLWS